MEKKTSKHCGNKFPGMNEYSNVQINADEVRDVVKKFERQTKSGRVFFPGDEPFAMKCETLLKNAAPDIEGLSVSGTSFTATDNTLYAEGDKPKIVSVDAGDIIAVLDNTKKGLFGNLAKKECLLGALVTTKGILTFCKADGKNSYGSGFVTWPTIAVSPRFGHAYETGIEFFPRENRKFPCGPMVCFSFWAAKAKGLERSLDEMGRHLVFVARGNSDEFDYDEFLPEGAGDGDEE